MGSRKSFDPFYHYEKTQRATRKIIDKREKDKVRFSKEFILRIQEKCIKNVKDLIWY